MSRRVLLAGSMFVGAMSAHAGSASGTLAVTAKLLSKNSCKFSVGATALALPFGSLDPSSAADVTQSTTTTFTCKGSAPMATFVLAADDGLWSSGAGARRMRHATLGTSYLPYSLALSPTTATVPKGTLQTVTITGIVLGSDYQLAPAGGYSDTVTITLTP